jgi:protein TonB
MTAYPIRRTSRFSAASLLLVAAAHVLVLWLLIQMNVIPIPEALKILSVQILPPDPPKPEPKVEIPKELPKPLPMKQKPAPRPVAVPLAMPEQAAVAAPTVESRPAEPLPPIAQPEPAKLSEPRFDADYLDNPRPLYPALSKRTGEQGRTLLRVHVTVDGRAAEVQIKTSSGSERLDQSALNAVRQWRFVPARRGEEAVAAWVLVPISFNLKE